MSQTARATIPGSIIRNIAVVLRIPIETPPIDSMARRAVTLCRTVKRRHARIRRNAETGSRRAIETAVQQAIETAVPPGIGHSRLGVANE